MEEEPKPKKRSGRPKGAPNKFTQEVKDMIRGALDDAGGQRYLAEQAKANPAAFLSLLSKIVPRQIDLGNKDGKPLGLAIYGCVLPQPKAKKAEDG